MSQTTSAAAISDLLPLWKDGRNGSAVQFVRSFSRLEKEEPRTYKLLKLEEGFECEDVNFVYKIGKSKYGLWLSRKRKEDNMENNNNNSSNNDNNGDNDTGYMKPETAAFITSQPSEQQPQQVVYPVSVKLEVDSKGYVKPSIHLYGYDADKTISETVRLFFEVKSQIQERGGKVVEA